MRFAVDHLTDKRAQDIVNRIDQQATSKIGIRSLPIRQKEYLRAIAIPILPAPVSIITSLFIEI